MQFAGRAKIMEQGDFMIQNSFRVKYRISIIFIFVSTIAIVGIPFAEMFDPSPKSYIKYIIGALFWLGVILEQTFFWMANADRKEIEQKLKRMNAQTFSSAPIGVLTFFQGREAAITDIALFAFAITVTLLSIFQCHESWIVIPCVSLLYLSFNLHCFLNGKNYRYIKSFSKHKKEQENNG